jgi:hypothetical protein
MSSSSRPGRPAILVAMMLALITMAPTVGDVGGCGGEAAPLDASKYFRERLRVECDRCRECGLFGAACTRACDPRTVVPSSFPPGCRPVEHDGLVCVRALEALACDAFIDVVDPQPIVPTECDFCPASDVEAGP